MGPLRAPHLMLTLAVLASAVDQLPVDQEPHVVLMFVRHQTDEIFPHFDLKSHQLELTFNWFFVYFPQLRICRQEGHMRSLHIINPWTPEFIHNNTK